MTSKKYSISAVIPAYNEEQSIREAVLRTLNTFQVLGLDFEIIIINDGSKDQTREIVLALVNDYSNIQVLHHEKNQGSGAAFETGIAHATKDYVVFVPVDNPLDIEDMKTYLPRMDVCDIVVGSRMERVGYGRLARFASFTYNRILIPLLFNIGLEDVNWISIYRRNLFVDDVITFNSRSLFWLVEILIRAKKKQLIIAEVPARMKKRLYGRPTCTRPTIVFQTFVEMIKFFLALRRDKKSR